MRNIASEWRNLAEGLLHVEALEAQFRAEWGPRLEEARRKINEAKLQRARERGRAALIIASVIAVLLSAVTVVMLLVSPLEAVAAFFFLALLVPVTLALYGVSSLLETPDSPFRYSNLSARWWHTISGRAPTVRRSEPALPARRYGEEGEVAFVSYLARALPKEYVAVRGLLVARNLDADVIVTGPTGIWVYEVKHWSGEIICERGEWRRVKTYRERGGRLVQELEVLRPFDRQWATEATAVKDALRRRLLRYPDLQEAVGGGLVFTHAGFSFYADGSCRARVFYAEVVCGGPLGRPGGARPHHGESAARCGLPPRAVRPAARATRGSAVGDVVRGRASRAPPPGGRLTGHFLPLGRRRAR